MHPTSNPTRPQRRRGHRPLRLAAATFAGLVALGACGDDSPSATGSTGSTPVASSPGTSSPGTSSPAPGVVEVTAIDFGYAGIPASVPAGTRFTLVNDAPAELHELVAFRLPDDEVRPVSELALLPAAELMPILGAEPATVLLAAPGGEQIPAVGDGTLATPGRYALICMIPTGVDPAEYLAAAAASAGGPPQVEGGPPHIVHGMWAELVVE